MIRGLESRLGRTGSDSALQKVPSLKWRQFVFLLVLLSSGELLLQKLLRQVFSADAEGNRQTKHNCSKHCPEKDQHCLFRNAQHLARHG